MRVANVSSKRSRHRSPVSYQGLIALAERFADQVPRDICMRSELLAREICDAWAAAQAAQAGLTSGAAAS